MVKQRVDALIQKPDSDTQFKDRQSLSTVKAKMLSRPQSSATAPSLWQFGHLDFKVLDAGDLLCGQGRATGDQLVIKLPTRR